MYRGEEDPELEALVATLLREMPYLSVEKLGKVIDGINTLMWKLVSPDMFYYVYRLFTDLRILLQALRLTNSMLYHVVEVYRVEVEVGERCGICGEFSSEVFELQKKYYDSLHFALERMREVEIPVFKRIFCYKCFIGSVLLALFLQVLLYTGDPADLKLSPCLKSYIDMLERYQDSYMEFAVTLFHDPVYLREVWQEGEEGGRRWYCDVCWREPRLLFELRLDDKHSLGHLCLECLVGCILLGGMLGGDVDAGE
jgi:RNase P subunit RPR2